MPDILSLSVKDFVAATAAKQPTPGGGSVAALCGALGAALGAMAMEYTIGKKAAIPHDAELRAALQQFQQASALFQELIAEDIAAFEALSAVLKLPVEARAGNAEYTTAVVAAIRAPQAVLGFALNLLERCATLVDKTNKHIVSDLAIAAVYAHATVHAAELNVRINLPLLPNQAEAAEMKVSVHALAQKADVVYAGIRAEMLQRF